MTRRGRRFQCGWCGRWRRSRKRMVEARPWHICKSCSRFLEAAPR